MVATFRKALDGFYLCNLEILDDHPIHIHVDDLVSRPQETLGHVRWTTVRRPCGNCKNWSGKTLEPLVRDPQDTLGLCGVELGLVVKEGNTSVDLAGKVENHVFHDNLAAVVVLKRIEVRRINTYSLGITKSLLIVFLI